MKIWVPLPALLSGCLLPTTVYIGRQLPDPVSEPDPPYVVDADRDGVTVVEGDCDDFVAEVHPGATELCNGRDDDCDGEVDGNKACAVEDRFTQAMKTDVLIVLDNSIEMEWDGYTQLADEGAVALTAPLIGATSDTRIGVLFNDMSNDQYKGQLVAPFHGSHPWIEGDNPGITADLVHRFFDQTMLFQQFEANEGAQGVRAAVAKAMGLVGDDDGAASSFFRSDASLNLVVVTNHDDDSSPDNDHFIPALIGAKGAPSQVTVYAVTQTTEFECRTGDPNPTADSIIELVQTTGGMYESVCMPDWTGFLSSVGQAIADQALGTTFTLTRPAQTGSISVTIEPDDGSEPYPWDGVALADPYTLVFTSAPPPIGTTIVVDYLRDWRD